MLYILLYIVIEESYNLVIQNQKVNYYLFVYVYSYIHIHLQLIPVSMRSRKKYLYRIVGIVGIEGLDRRFGVRDKYDRNKNATLANQTRYCFRESCFHQRTSYTYRNFYYSSRVKNYRL